MSKLRKIDERRFMGDVISETFIDDITGEHYVLLPGEKNEEKDSKFSTADHQELIDEALPG